jgi:hypothetical protein
MAAAVGHNLRLVGNIGKTFVTSHLCYMNAWQQLWATGMSARNIVVMLGKC